MSEIVAVLVVPAEGDPGGLLAAGRLGAMPPMHSACRGCGRWGCWSCAHLPGAPLVTGLALWLDGDIIQEGWDRARRVAGVHPTPAPLVDAVIGFAGSLVRAGLASRVVRLTRDDSGRLVEVLP